MIFSWLQLIDIHKSKKYHFTISEIAISYTTSATTKVLPPIKIKSDFLLAFSAAS